MAFTGRSDSVKDGDHLAEHHVAVDRLVLRYNFVRIHKTLRTTPAMAANVTKRLWGIGDIVMALAKTLSQILQ
jgi:hypothetical protein